MPEYYTTHEVLSVDLDCGCELTILGTDDSYRALCWSPACVESELAMRAHCAAKASKIAV